MTSKYDFLSPADSDSFLGRRSEISDFSNLLRGFRAGKGPNGTVVVGAPGMGKSSLLQIFKRTAMSDQLVTVEHSMHYQKKASQTLSELYTGTIEPHLDIKKRKKYDKKFTQIPPISPDGDSKKAVEVFLKNLALAELKNPLVVFIDDVDRAEMSGYGQVIVGLADLISTFTQQHIPIFFVIAMLDSTWEVLKSQIGHTNRFHLDLLDISTAELVLRKKAGTSLREPEFRKQILGEIDRSPFGLTLAADIIRWHEEQLEEEEEQSLDILRKAVIPILRERKFGEAIEKMLGLSAGEKKIIQTILGQPSNFITSQDLQTVCSSTSNELTRLEEIGLTKTDGNLVFLAKNALFERMQGQAEIVTSIESDLMLRLIEGDLRAGFKPASSMLDQLEAVATRGTESGESARSLGAKGKAIYRLAFDKGHLYDACRLAILAGQFLVASGDKEGSGLFLEESGKEFSDAARPNYAKLLYREAMNTYSTDWRIKSCAREAARIYGELAEAARAKNRLSFARAFLYEAALLYQIADEPVRLQTAIADAKETYAADEKGSDFFEKLENQRKT
ncbi:MAG: ATP-binding protein [Candidatus Heimdallarchaeota archaeon]